jgi:hypothetical protein
VYSIAIIRMDVRGKHEYAVLLNQDKTVCGFLSVVDGIRDFEKKYESGQRRSYEGSMSALLNWAFFRPAIVEVADVKDIVNLVEDPENLRMASYSHISGNFNGLVLDPTKAEAVWEKGAKPSLIA